MILDADDQPTFALRTFFRRFRGKISLTLLMVLLEAATALLFPLIMGFAINDLLSQSFDGLIQLAMLGFASLIIGSVRRAYDTRTYARIYSTIANELVDKEQRAGSPVSKISARANLLTEMVEFLENSFPQIVNSVIAIVGTLMIILSLNGSIFVACLATSLFILAVYGLGGKHNFRLNKGYNDEFERQVDVLESADKEQISTHFKSMMRWNVRLSDFETFNFSLAWVAMILLLLYAIYAAVMSGLGAFGTIFSLVVYVFEYIESVIVFPLYYQQAVRLKEISSRLN